MQQLPVRERKRAVHQGRPATPKRAAAVEEASVQLYESLLPLSQSLSEGTDSSDDSVFFNLRKAPLAHKCYLMLNMIMH